jgi:hypothetical protein
MTMLQCVRCIDPIGTNLILSYDAIRFISLTVTLTIYFEYSATSYVVMDTLYACALKKTPSWLNVILTILPVSEVLVGFGMAIAQYTVAQQWVAAVVSFHVAVVFSVNMITYDISGLKLIRILRDHQNGTATATGEDLSGSQSAKPFEVVIKKTYRSMLFLSVPSLGTVIGFFYTALTAANTLPFPAFDPTSPQPAMLLTIFVHLILGLVFTRFCWISKTALDAEILAKTSSPPSSHGTPSTERTTRTMSRAEVKEKAARMSQSPKPRASEEISPPNSRPDVEMPEVLPAKTGMEKSTSKSDVDNSLLVFNEADIV